MAFIRRYLFASFVFCPRVSRIFLTALSEYCPIDNGDATRFFHLAVSVCIISCFSFGSVLLFRPCLLLFADGCVCVSMRRNSVVSCTGVIS